MISAFSLGCYIIILVLWQSPGHSCLPDSHYKIEIKRGQILKQSYWCGKGQRWRFRAGSGGVQQKRGRRQAGAKMGQTPESWGLKESHGVAGWRGSEHRSGWECLQLPPYSPFPKATPNQYLLSVMFPKPVLQTKLHLWAPPIWKFCHQGYLSIAIKICNQCKIPF